jgi:hypothetical protein
MLLSPRPLVGGWSAVASVAVPESLMVLKPPRGLTLAMHKKDTRLLVVRPLQNPGTPHGCVAESPQQLQRIARSLLVAEPGR